VPPKSHQMITQTALRITGFSLTITVLAMVSACSTQALVDAPAGPSVQESMRHPQKIGDRAAAIALRQVGVPYRYGGATVRGFDCSGLVQYSYGLAGKAVPRTTGQLWSATSTVPRGQLQAGDLLFFSFDGKMSHVGMYIGGQRFVHAPSSGRNVAVASLTSPFYASALVRAGRPK